MRSFYFVSSTESSTAAQQGGTEHNKDEDSSSLLLRQALLLGYDEDGDGAADDGPDTNNSSAPSRCGSLCDKWVVQPFLLWALPFLVWLDFGLVLQHIKSNVVEIDSGVPDMLSLHLSFIMFLLATYLYRKTVDEYYSVESVFVVLVPEFAMNAVLLLLFTNHVVAAFWMLLAASVGMSIGVLLMFASANRPGRGRESLPDGDGTEDLSTGYRGFNDRNDDDTDVEKGRMLVVVPSVRR